MPSPIVTNTTAGLNGKRIALLDDFIIYRPEDYGAVGDGVTNDTVPIQNCINAALLTGGTVLFGAKVYVITATITLDQNGGRPISLQGQGKNLNLQVAGISGTTIKNAGTLTSVLYLKNLNGSSIRGFTIDCTFTAQSGIKLECAVGCVFDSIAVKGSGGYAFDLIATTAGVYRNTFSNLSTDINCRQAMHHSSQDLAVNNVDIASNTFA